MSEFDTRVVAYLIWGVGTVLVWGIVLRNRRRQYRRLRTRQARSALMSAIGLFLTALCSFLSITAVFWGEPGTSARGFLIAVALGAFFMAGLIRAVEETP